MNRVVRNKGRRETGFVGRLLLLAGGLVAMAWAGRALIDQLVHAPRYAISGRATIEPAAYVAATRRALPPAARIARLVMPRAGGPVIVSASSATVYLDPPTARVLDVVSGDPSEDGAAPASAAQSVSSVIARARPFGAGALDSVEWPTRRSPDWTIAFDKGASVKVADDSGTARAALARQPDSATRLASRLGRQARGNVLWQVAILLVGIVAALPAIRGIAGRRRPPG